jgi:hypothetical protein
VSAIMEEEELRHTGLWPFNIFPHLAGSWSAASGNTPQGIVFDPVALAYNAGSKLIDAGWVGLELMPTKFLWRVVDSRPEQLEEVVSDWVSSHQSAIADVFEERLASYTVDDLAKRAAAGALHSYRGSHFIATVRTLIPEFERFGRMAAQSDGSLPSNQKQAVESIQTRRWPKAARREGVGNIFQA